MLVSQLAEEQATEVGESFSDVEIQFQFIRWVIDATSEVYTAEPWFFRKDVQSLVTVPGEANYQLPERTATLLSVTDIHGVPVTIQPLEFLAGAGVIHTQSGVPQVCVMRGVDELTGSFIVQLWPVPPGEISYNIIRTKSLPENLSAEGAVIPLPSDFHLAVRLLVNARYYENAASGEAAMTKLDRTRQRAVEQINILRRTYRLPAGIDRRYRYRDLPRSTSRGVGMFTLPTLIPT